MGALINPGLPAKSKIVLSTDCAGFPQMVLPSSTSVWMRFPTAAFLLFWLGGWTVGGIAAMRGLYVSHHGAGDLFLLFWLGGWALGESYAIFYLYRILRPSIPETLTLARPSLIHDSGIQPPDMMSFNHYAYRNRQKAWKKVFQKRKVTIFTPGDIATMKVRDIDGGNRLTIDQGNERFDLGESLTEVEREWLFERLKSEYGL